MLKTKTPSINISLTNIVFSVSIAMFFVAGMVSMTFRMKSLQYPLLIVAVMMALSKLVIQNKGIISISKNISKYMIWPFICLLTGIISAVSLKDKDLALNTVAIFLVFGTFFVVFILISNEKLEIDGVMKILFWAVTVSSLLTNGLKLTNQMGVFYNLNSFGGVYSCFFTYFLAKINNREAMLQKSVYCLISIFLVITSSSRGAFVSAAFVATIWLLLYLRNSSWTNYAKILAVVIILILIYFYTPIHTIFTNSIMSKFLRKSGNETSGRVEIWVRVLREISWKGHGRYYFDQFRWGAHNTYISILGQYGIIGIVAYIGLFLNLLFTSIKSFVKFDKIQPVLYCASFFTMSMFEGMLMKISMFLMLYGITCCIWDENDEIYELNGDEQDILYY